MTDQNLSNPNPDKPTVLRSELAVPRLPPTGLVDTVRTAWKGIRPAKIILFLISVFLFILAITLMKEGASDLTPLLRSGFAVTNPVSSLGFGWLFAYLILSGSPVAAAALTFFDVGAIDRLSAFTMIIGSRLGASFIVLFIGFIYVLRGRDRATGLSMGLLSLSVTGTTYLVALVFGIVLLQTEALDQIHPQSERLLASVIDLMFSPVVGFARRLLPLWGLFLLGLGIIMVSFNLFDRCLPQMALKESQVGRVSRLVYRSWVMFITRFLGSTATRVIEQAPCPVIIAKGGPGPVHRILLCDSCWYCDRGAPIMLALPNLDHLVT